MYSTPVIVHINHEFLIVTVSKWSRVLHELYKDGDSYHINFAVDNWNDESAPIVRFLCMWKIISQTVTSQKQLQYHSYICSSFKIISLCLEQYDTKLSWKMAHSEWVKPNASVLSFIHP
jgi:hypothetical protein